MKKNNTFLLLILSSLILIPSACEKNDQNGDASGYRPVVIEYIIPGRINKTIYTYTSNRISNIEEIYNLGTDDETNWIETMEYPDANTVIGYAFNPNNERRPTERFTFNNNHVTKWEVLGIKDDIWKANEEYNYSYSGDQLMEVTVKHGNYITGELTIAFSMTYKYEGGKISEVLKYNAYQEKDIEKVVFEYEGERLLRLVINDPLENTWVEQWKEELVYGANGIRSVGIFECSNNTWYHRGDINFNYDEYGNCIELAALNYTVRWTYETGQGNYQDLCILPHNKIRFPYTFYDQ